MSSRTRFVLLASILVTAGGAVVAACLDRPFTCADDAACVYRGAQGRCEADHRCSFPDSSCASGFRYAAYGRDTACASVVASDAGGGGALGTSDGGGDAEPAMACTATSVTSGAAHTCATLEPLGSVECWGDNTDGQLGDGTRVARSRPQPVTGLAVVIGATSTVVAGAAHTCAIGAGGAVACWGRDADGQLGDGVATPEGSATPALVRDLPPATQLAAGAAHTCALSSESPARVFCWGAADQRQLGPATKAASARPVEVNGLGDVVSIAAGDAFTCALRRDGTSACWGANDRKQVAADATAVVDVPHVRADAAEAAEVALGGRHACIRRASGQIVCWGANADGETGHPMSTSEAPAVVAGVPAARAIAAGEASTCALTTTGGAWCWGRGDSGQLGAGSDSDSFAPVTVAASMLAQLSVGGAHACARSSVGKLSCWGRAARGALGNRAVIHQERPTRSPAVNLAVELAAGGGHTCARLVDASVSCWGRGTSGELGDGARLTRSTPAPVDGLAGVAQIAAGGAMSCARKSDGKVLCWGAGNEGQSGAGDTNPRVRPVAVALPAAADEVALGVAHGCARMGGKLACWGHGDCGEIGNGARADALAPVAVPGIEDAVAVAAGAHFTCAVRRPAAGASSVWCWGDGMTGVLGGGSAGPTAAPVEVAGGAGAVAIAAGATHVCATFAGGAVRCWGTGASGQLGSPTARVAVPTAVDGLPAASALAGGGAHACAVVIDGSAWCWGSDADGQLGDGAFVDRSSPKVVASKPGRIVSIAAGETHTCFATKEFSVYCFGRNEEGQLGDGVRLEEPKPVGVMPTCTP